MSNMQVANEILAQLGGRRFTMMTGAKNLLGGDNFLQFDLPRGSTNKATKCRVTLDASDTYTVTFYKWNARTLELTTLSEDAGIYCDMLQEIFTAKTGMYTRLAA